MVFKNKIIYLKSLYIFFISLSLIIFFFSTAKGEGKAFEIIIQEMHDAGYNLVAHKYKFEKYGVPQKRHRIIIIGIKKELEFQFRVPKPFDNEISAKSALDGIKSRFSKSVFFITFEIDIVPLRIP